MYLLLVPYKSPLKCILEKHSLTKIEKTGEKMTVIKNVEAWKAGEVITRETQENRKCLAFLWIDIQK